MLSVVMSTFNRPPAIFEAVIHSISKQIGAKDIELIVINDGGTVGIPDQILDFYKDKFKIVKYFYNNNPGMTGCALGFNIGIQQSTGEHVILSGSDVLWGRDILNNIEKALTESEDHKVVVGPSVFGMTFSGNKKILDIHPDMRQAVLPANLDLPSEHAIATEDVICTYSHPTRDDLFFKLPIHFLSAYHRDVLCDIGGLNERFNEPGIGPGYEDTEFNKRLFLYGCKPVWINQIAYHLFHADKTEGYIPYIDSESILINRSIYDNQTNYKANEGKEWGVIK